jgi:two-component system, cell cycle sensor histidine kinase and response regulator CckA
MSEGVIVTDGAHRVILVNSAFESMSGYRMAEVVERSWAVLRGPQSNPDTVRAIDHALQQRQAFSGEILSHRKDGSTFWCDLSMSPVRDDDGTLTHFMVFLRDISSRKRAEFEWQEDAVRFRDAAEAAGSFVLDIDADFRYTHVSKQAEQLLGYTAEDMLGHTPAEFMPPGEIDKINAWFESNLQKDGSVRGLEHRIITKSGAVRWLHVSRIPLRDSQGTLTGYRGTAYDITARKQAELAHAELEAQMRESHKMEAIGTLAGGIAHDFNNIIATILGNVSLARQDVSQVSPAHESLEEIHIAASRARDLVSQILAFSRRQQTQYRRTDLAPVVGETARMLRAMLPARVAIDVHCAANTPDVMADASQIQQVLVILATNAMQAMQGRPGHVRITLDADAPDEDFLKRHPSVRALLHPTPEALTRLVVSDDGPGMDSATLARIFEPFFTTKPVGEGTGLGLAVVHGIVQGHHGVIVVDSQPGAGARFTLFLPSDKTPTDPTPVVHPPEHTRPAVEPPPTLRSAAAAGEVVPRPHIVYVDDDEALVSLVKRLLERRGYRVSAHDDQLDALATISADPSGIDLLLTDYNMPGMSGLDLAREARAIRADLPVGIASGFIDETLSAEAAGAGVRSLIFKATSVDEFCAAIEALLPTKI